MHGDRLRVYIAGPYSMGDPVRNARAALDAAEEVWKSGHFPYLPHLTMFWHYVYPKPWEQWLEMDEEWLAQCDVLIRLPGESAGADQEVAFAQYCEITVYHSVEEFLDVHGDGHAHA